MDGRRFNGGPRPGAGRKPKEDEDRIRTLSGFKNTRLTIHILKLF